MGKKLKLIIAIGLVFLLNISVVAGYFKMSQKQEIQVGAQAAAQVEKKLEIIYEPKVHEYINKLGNTLVKKSKRRDIRYTFKVANDKAINAFALPGGFIYINRGLIEAADSEHELVGVLAHEIAHVTQRHGVNQVARAKKAQIGFAAAGILAGLAGMGGPGLNQALNGAYLVTQGTFSKFSRDAEREADREGAVMMAKAGWNPKGMITFFQKLAKQGNNSVNFFSTHPSPKERYNNIASMISNWNTSTLKTNSFEFSDIKKVVSNYQSKKPIAKNTTNRYVRRTPTTVRRRYPTTNRRTNSSIMNRRQAPTYRSKRIKLF